MKRILILSLLLLLPIVVTAELQREYRLKQGSCDNGKKWWCVSEYENGFLTEIHGVDCSGNEYHKQGWRIVPTDPTNGESPTDTGVGSNGNPWYVVVHVADGMVTWEGGQASDGTYWVYDQSTSADIPGLN